MPPTLYIHSIPPCTQLSIQATWSAASSFPSHACPLCNIHHGASPVILLLLPLHLHPPTNHIQFTFYAAYHDNTINKWIHIFCIWPLLFTALICFWAIPPGYLSYLALPPALAAKLSVHGVQLTVNWALLGTVIYILFYLSLEAKNFKKMTGVGVFAVSLWWGGREGGQGEEGRRGGKDGNKTTSRREQVVISSFVNAPAYSFFQPFILPSPVLLSRPSWSVSCTSWPAIFVPSLLFTFHTARKALTLPPGKPLSPRM